MDKVFTVVKDSGARQEFASGSVRDTRKGKGRYDLVTPIGLSVIAGAKPYERATRARDQQVKDPTGAILYLVDEAKHILWWAINAQALRMDSLGLAGWLVLAALEIEEGGVVPTGVRQSRFDSVPHRGLRRLAVHYENGAAKYNERNWELGQDVARYCDSGLRHLWNYTEGKRDEDHLAASAWNVAAAIHTLVKTHAGGLPEALDNLPKDQAAGAQAAEPEAQLPQ